MNHESPHIVLEALRYPLFTWTVANVLESKWSQREVSEEPKQWSPILLLRTSSLIKRRALFVSLLPSPSFPSILIHTTAHTFQYMDRGLLTVDQQLVSAFQSR